MTIPVHIQTPWSWIWVPASVQVIRVDPHLQDSTPRHPDRAERDWRGVLRTVQQAVAQAQEVAPGGEGASIALAVTDMDDVDADIAKSWISNSEPPTISWLHAWGRDTVENGRHRLWATHSIAAGPVPVKSLLASHLRNMGHFSSYFDDLIRDSIAAEAAYLDVHADDPVVAASPHYRDAVHLLRERFAADPALDPTTLALFREPT